MTSTLQSEMQAILFGLSMLANIKDLANERVMIVSGSLESVEILKGVREVSWMLEDIKQKTVLLKGRLAGLHFVHISRECNKGAKVVKAKFKCLWPSQPVVSEQTWETSKKETTT
nr:hypothetical protein [Tanacetum cinerariifolium]